MSQAVTIYSPSTWPGEDREAANHAALDVLANPPSGVGGVPGLLVLPARGPASWPVARALGVLESMPASLEPHGWRLSGSAGVEQRQARRLLEGDVEAFALALAGQDGVVQIPMLGPFSLAAATWLRVGERVISDAVARDDLIDSLALGVTRLLDSLAAARDLPTLLSPPVREGVTSVREGAMFGREGATSRARILLHEPWLTQIIRGTVPSFSGRRTLAALSPGTVTSGLRALIAAWRGHDVTVQVQPDPAAFGVVGDANPAALRLDPTTLDPRSWERLAELVEGGIALEWASVPLSGAGRERVSPNAVAASVLRPLRRIGLPRARISLALVPGVSAQSPVAARASLAGLARAAVAVGDALSD